MRKQLNVFPIIKVASTCNLGCTYCSAEEYMEHKPDSLMSKQTAKTIIEEMAAVRPNGVFLWHGGEPMLVGKEFYEFVTELQAELGLEHIVNSMQSNAVLMSDGWAQLLKEKNFKVGISIDGPEAIHNELRVFHNGAGSHKQVVRGMRVLEENDKHFGVLVVVTKQSRKHAKKIFEFLLESGIESMDFKPCYGKEAFDISLIDFANFMNEIFDLWVEHDNPNVRIRTLEGFIQNFLGGQASQCTQTGGCARIITINYNGDVYPCDRFLEPQYKFGNINETPLEELYDESEGAIRFRSHIDDNRKKCVGCSYQPVCKSGCTQEQDYWPEEYCRHREIMIDHIREWLVTQGEEPIKVSAQ